LIIWRRKLTALKNDMRFGLESVWPCGLETVGSGVTTSGPLWIEWWGRLDTTLCGGVAVWICAYVTFINW
jgi:hypothetical protein